MWEFRAPLPHAKKKEIKISKFCTNGTKLEIPLTNVQKIGFLATKDLQPRIKKRDYRNLVPLCKVRNANKKKLAVPSPNPKCVQRKPLLGFHWCLITLISKKSLTLKRIESSSSVRVRLLNPTLQFDSFLTNPPAALAKNPYKPETCTHTKGIWIENL